MSPHGQKSASYPADMRKSILSKRVRCDGIRGDMVLFNDQGFHGPDHPSRSERLTILLDYLRVKTFGQLARSGSQNARHGRCARPVSIKA